MSRRRAFNSHVAYAAVAWAASLGIAGAAHAAESKPSNSAVSELVITAERRTENLESAPLAANVLSQENLDEKGVRTIDDLEYAVPSLTISSGGQSNYMNIRGIGKNDNAGNTTSAVATYRDGVGTVSGFFNGEPYYDIKSVEVLRGPQGTFVGQNAAGGAIFVNTNDPSPGGGPSGWIELGGANYSQFEAQGAINIPLGDTLAVRIAFDHMQRDSFYHVFMDPAKTIKNPNNVGARDMNSLRIGTLWRPSDAFEVKLKVDLNNLNYHGNAFSVLPNFPLPRGLNLSDDIFTIGNNITDNKYRDLINRGALEAKYKFDNGISLRSITGIQYIDTFLRNDDDGSVIPNPDDPTHTGVNTQINIQGVFRLFTQEVAIVSPDTDRFSWILGAYYQRENLKFPAVHPDRSNGFIAFDTVTGVEGLGLFWNTTRITKAVFGQASYKLTDSLELQAGLRYSDYRVTEDALLNLGFDLPNLHTHEQDDRVTGKIALNWQVNPDNYLYAFIATGHTTGGVGVVNWPAFGLPQIPVTFGPQETTDYETGWKAKFFDSSLHTQLGVFYDRITGYQAAFAIPEALNLSLYQNLKTPTTVYGVELTAQGAVGDFSYDLGAALLHSSAGHGVLTNITAGTVGFGDTFDLAGHRLPYTPEATFNIGAQYAFHVGEGTLTPRIDFGWTSEQRISLDDLVNAETGVHYQRVPAHDNLNLQLIYKHGDVQVTAYMTNVADNHYIQADGGGGDNAYANEPRQFGVRVNKRF